MVRVGKFLLFGLFFGIFFLIGLGSGWYYFVYRANPVSPFVAMRNMVATELPLEKYSIDRLKDFPLRQSKLTITEKIEDNTSYSSYIFTYEGTDVGRGGKISGQINLPHNISASQKAIVMLRGYVPLDIYETGVGTRAAAEVFAQNGYITLAPDFLGYGQSDPEPEDTWEARFIKPVHVMELISLVEQTDFRLINCQAQNMKEQNLMCEQKEAEDHQVEIGMWAHSNGGQIALTVLEAEERSIPTTLWAPVTSPFPYSILFFSDENDDEGKASRRWLAQFEQDYDVFQFSLTKHLDKLFGPIIIHHGTADEAALISWNQEFVDKVQVENEIRQANNLLAIEQATDSATGEAPEEIPLIEIKFYTYPGADHNMKPSWNNVIARDLEFFSQQF